MPERQDRRRRRRSSSYSSSESSGAARRRKRRAIRAANGEVSKWGSLQSGPDGAAPQGVTYTHNFTNGPASGAPNAAAPSTYQGQVFQTGSSVASATAALTAPPAPLDTSDILPIAGPERLAAMRQKMQGDISLGPKAPPPSQKPTAKPTPPPSENVLMNPLMGGAPGKKAPAAKPVGAPQTSLTRSLTLDIPRNRCGALIGKEGRNHQALVAKCGCEVKIPSYDAPPETKLVIRGEASRVEMARREIEATLQITLPVVEDVTSGSRVICLTNLVARPEDADDELTNAVKQECQKFGPVTNVLVYDETQPLDGSVVTKLLVQFQLGTSAQRALEKMNGRYFDRRKIVCEYHCEEAFLRLMAS